MTTRRCTTATVLVGAIACLATACGTQPAIEPPLSGSTAGTTASPSPSPSPTPILPNLLPGMPPPLQADDVYAATRDGLAPAVRGFPELIYVPNGVSNTVTVIDAETATVVGEYPAGDVPQHVVPSYDLTTLWVNSSSSNTLTRMDPATGRVIDTIEVDDPYNLYFTPDGKDAVVIAERLRRIDFRDPETMELRASLPTPCKGVNHVDFSADGRTFVASCEFSAQLIEVDTAARAITRTLDLPRGSKPQDVKLSPDGAVYFIADLNRDGVVVLDAASFTEVGFVPTGTGAHGLYTSRDSRDLYVTNRGAGSVSVLELASRTVRATYQLPGGASPDMGNLSVDGTKLWLSSRYGSQIYALDMTTGQTTATVEVGQGPHGLTVYPQPGRYSLGHTGILR
ncbi:MAG: YncE family protein [Actinomycetota bacterium]|nr:YncE family protein [Actinomycetota bacterium]